MEPGEVVEMGPGEKVTCRRSGKSGGDFEFDIELAAGVDGPPTHHHPEDEWMEIVEGEVLFVVDGEERHLRPGDTLLIPAGTPHTFRVPKGAATLRARGRHGLRFERVVDQHAGGGPAFTRMALYLTRVDPGASYMVNPAVRALLRVIAWVGRIRGVQLRPT